ncbi:MAG: hypothetical protein K6A44_01800 [bacterium]|nr:hypothetical protein [bacterium]
MKRILVILVCVMFLMPLKAEAFSWKDFFNWLFSPVETTTVDTTELYKDTTTKLTNIQTQADAITPSVKPALVAVASTISTQSEVKELNTKLEAKNADVFNVITDYQKTVNSEKARVLVTIKTLTEADKTTFAKDVNALAAIGQKYSALADEVSAVRSDFSSKAPSGTDRTTKLKEIDAVYENVATKASKISTFTNLIKLYARLTGLSI